MLGAESWRERAASRCANAARRRHHLQRRDHSPQCLSKNDATGNQALLGRTHPTQLPAKRRAKPRRGTLRIVQSRTVQQQHVNTACTSRHGEKFTNKNTSYWPVQVRSKLKNHPKPPSFLTPSGDSRERTTITSSVITANFTPMIRGMRPSVSPATTIGGRPWSAIVGVLKQTCRAWLTLLANNAYTTQIKR